MAVTDFLGMTLLEEAQSDKEITVNAALVALDAQAALTPFWVKQTIGHAALSAAAIGNSVELFSLRAGGVIHAVKVKHSAAFTGGGISAYTLSVGVIGDLDRYSPAFDVFQAPGNTVQQVSGIIGTEDHGAAVSIRLAAISTGDNLDQATAGSVEVWTLVSFPV
jgi:streptogramin lyase